MANPVGLVTGLENVAQVNNAYVVASWPANPANDNVKDYEVRWYRTAGEDSGTATADTATTLTDGSKNWGPSTLAGYYALMGGTYAKITDNTATQLTFSAGWVDINGNAAATPAIGAYVILHYFSAQTGNLSLKVSGLLQNTNYTFNLRAINNLNQYSLWSPDKSIVTKVDALAPAVPTGLIAYKTPRGALIGWTANAESDLQGYTLEYAVALAAAITGGIAITSITCQPLAFAVGSGSTITITDGVHTFNATLSGPAAAGATTLAVSSVTPVDSYTTAAAYILCKQYVEQNSLSTSTPFIAPSGTPLGTPLRFRVAAIDWTGNQSAYSAVSTAVNSDGIVFDELLVGSLKVFGMITTGGLQTAASGARVVVDSTSIRIYDGTATNYGAPTGAGVRVELKNDGTGFFSGTVKAAGVNASYLFGTSADANVPTLPTPPITNGVGSFMLDPANGLRFWSGNGTVATLIAQWAANGTLTIYSGASIYGSTLATSSTEGNNTDSTAGFKLSGSFMDLFGTTGGLRLWSYDSVGAAWKNGGAIAGNVLTTGGGFKKYVMSLTNPNAAADGVEIPTMKTAGGGGGISISGTTIMTETTGATNQAPINLNLTANNGAGSFAGAGKIVITGGLQADITQAGNVPVLFQSLTPSSGASVTSNTFPANKGYNHIEIRIDAPTPTTSTGTLLIQFNGDTANNYGWVNWEAINNANPTGSSTGTTNGIRVSFVGGDGTFTKVMIADYNNTTKKKRVIADAIRTDGVGVTNMFQSRYVGRWESSAAITSVTVLLSAGTFAAGTRIDIYLWP